MEKQNANHELTNSVHLDKLVGVRLKAELIVQMQK